MQRKALFAASVGVIVGASLVSTLGLARQPAEAPPPPFEMPTEAEMTARLAAAADPGPHHKFLERFAGEYDISIRVWTQGQGQPPAETKGTAKARMILGGRFLLEEMEGELMGQPYTGMSLMGYDAFMGKYISFHIDSMSTAMHTAEGYSYPPGKVITMWGTMNEPALGLRDIPVRYITRVIDEDTHIFEVHDFNYPDGRTKVVEIEYNHTGG